MLIKQTLFSQAAIVAAHDNERPDNETEDYKGFEALCADQSRPLDGCGFPPLGHHDFHFVDGATRRAIVFGWEPRERHRTPQTILATIVDYGLGELAVSGEKEKTDDQDAGQ